MAKPTFLNESVSFERPITGSDGYGNQVTSGWVAGHVCRAEFIYSRGSEAVDAARLQGRSIFKIRIRQCQAARAITTDWRMVDNRRVTYASGVAQSGVYNIREVDAITDRQWIYIVAEAGVAV